jgi:predicted RNase H-like HicB family nuclease
MVDGEGAGADDPRGPLLVEFPSALGVVEAALTPAELVQRSSEALDAASATIREMARKFGQELADMPIKPRELQMEFGVKLTVEAGAFVAKAGGEGALTVRMTWSTDQM